MSSKKETDYGRQFGSVEDDAECLAEGMGIMYITFWNGMRWVVFAAIIAVAVAPRHATADDSPDKKQTRGAGADRSRLVELLAREVAQLHRENRQLRAENDRLRAKLDDSRKERQDHRMRRQRRSEQGGTAERRIERPKAMAEVRRRFIDRGEYVEDERTGLLWQKDGDASGTLNFYQAAQYARSLELGGLANWRVPTREELAAIFPAVELPFVDTHYRAEQCCERPGEWPSYWTSELDTRLDDYAYIYQWYADGGANNCFASRNQGYVRCVHDPVRRDR